MKQRSTYIVGVVLAVVLLLVGGLVSSHWARAANIDELRDQLGEKKDALQEAEERIKKFKEEIQIKKQEAKTLKDQIAIIDDNIAQIKLNVAETIAEIEKTDIEIEVVESEIKEKEEEINHQKKMLAGYIRLLYTLNQQSSVTIFLKYNTFSEAVNEAATLQDLQRKSHEALLTIKDLKANLEKKKQDLDEFKEALKRLHERQAKQQATLAANKDAKENVLDLTKEQEKKYQALLAESKEAYQQAEAEINHINSVIREELRKQGINSLPSVGVFDWPIEPIFGISCEFHCTGYPYAYLIGPHAGMDIPTYVGTPVRAPADGYVARVHSVGTSRGYNYIMLIHGDNISTIYGHLSGFAVSEGDMVSRGDVIGYTGGAPGTIGSGLSSGPHLHFEVRKNNIPVNPRNYL